MRAIRHFARPRASSCGEPAGHGPDLVRPRPPLALAGGPKTNSFNALISASALVAEAGQTPGEKIIRVAREPAGEKIAVALNLKVNDPVVEIVRVRTANGVPVLIERLVFPLRFGERFLDTDGNEVGPGVTFGQDESAIHILTRAGEDTEVGPADKVTLAHAVWDAVQQYFVNV